MSLHRLSFLPPPLLLSNQSSNVLLRCEHVQLVVYQQHKQDKHTFHISLLSIIKPTTCSSSVSCSTLIRHEEVGTHRSAALSRLPDFNRYSDYYQWFDRQLVFMWPFNHSSVFNQRVFFPLSCWDFCAQKWNKLLKTQCVFLLYKCWKICVCVCVLM